MAARATGRNCGRRSATKFERRDRRERSVRLTMGMFDNGSGANRVDLPPFQRTRRLRRTEAMRRLVRETTLHPADFIYPLFITYGRGVRRPIVSMPGQMQLSVDELPDELAELAEL